jgi:hypothetical protein
LERRSKLFGLPQRKTLYNVPIKVMIEKKYYQNINVHKPRDYFEKWYADVWKRRVGKKSCDTDQFRHILVEELAQAGATIDYADTDYRVKVVFNSDNDYTMFVLKWS